MIKFFTNGTRAIITALILSLIPFSAVPLQAQNSATSQSNVIFPAFVATATTQTSPSIVLGKNPGGSGGSFSVGTISVAGTSLTTVTFSVLGSSDGGNTYQAININAINAPGTVSTTATTTSNGLYQVNLSGLTNVEISTSGTFTATSVKFTLTASPAGVIARLGSGSGSSPVTSVFGRIGAVAATSGDYNASQITNAAATNAANTFSVGGQTNSANGAASAPAEIMSGQPYTAGTASTNYPLFYFNCSGATAPSTWNTGGTWLGFNLCSGFTGNTTVIDIHDNGGASVFQLLGNGAFNTASSVTAASIKINGAQTTVNCSTSGSAIFSQPLQGTIDKKVLIHMSACLGTASYTYPTAFTNSPSIYASNNVAASIATSVSITAVTVTGATSTGSLALEDY